MYSCYEIIICQCNAYAQAFSSSNFPFFRDHGGNPLTPQRVGGLPMRDRMYVLYSCHCCIMYYSGLTRSIMEMLFCYENLAPPAYLKLNTLLCYGAQFIVFMDFNLTLSSTH